MTKTISHKLEKHGDVRIDDYYWLRERDNPEVIEYLEAENERTREGMSHLEGLMDTLFTEIKDRIKDTDTSVPYRLRDYFIIPVMKKVKNTPFIVVRLDPWRIPKRFFLMLMNWQVKVSTSTYVVLA